MLDDIRKNTYKIRWSKSVVFLIHCVVVFLNILLDKVSRTNRQTFAITPMKSMLFLYLKAVIEYLEESKVQIDRLLSYL